MSSSKALRTVRPPKPESNTPIAGRRDRCSAAPWLAFMHLIASEFAASLDLPQTISVENTNAAAWPRRDRRTMRACAGMIEEGADFVGGFGRQDMLELAGLLFDFRFAVHSKAVGE